LIHSFFATRIPRPGTGGRRTSDLKNHPVFGDVNQWRFAGFLFHLTEVAVAIDFAHEKKMFFTRFAHRKYALWKSCELHLGSGCQTPAALDACRRFHRLLADREGRPARVD
jgi:hypothetical protein